MEIFGYILLSILALFCLTLVAGTIWMILPDEISDTLIEIAVDYIKRKSQWNK